MTETLGAFLNNPSPGVNKTVIAVNKTEELSGVSDSRAQGGMGN